MRGLWRLITWPFRELGYLLVNAFFWLVTHTLELFVKLMDNSGKVLFGNNIDFDESDPKNVGVNKYDHNINAIINDMWVPDKKMERLFGMSAIDEGLKIPETLTYDEIIYCYKQYRKISEARLLFEAAYLEEYTAVVKEQTQALQDSLAGKNVKHKRFSGKILTVKYIRKLWKKCLKKAKSTNEPIPTTKEEMITEMEVGLRMFRPLLSRVFLSMYQSMIMMRWNFYGYKTPIYNI